MLLLFSRCCGRILLGSHSQLPSWRADDLFHVSCSVLLSCEYTHRTYSAVVTKDYSNNFLLTTSAAIIVSKPMYRANKTDIPTKKPCGAAVASEVAHTATMSIAMGSLGVLVQVLSTLLIESVPCQITVRDRQRQMRALPPMLRFWSNPPHE